MLTQKDLDELKEFSPFMAEAIENVVRIHMKKARDYGKGSNPFFNFERMAGILKMPVDSTFKHHLVVKEVRLESLLSDGREPANEPLADTYMDMACYGMLRYAFFLAEQSGTIDPFGD